MSGAGAPARRAQRLAAPPVPGRTCPTSYFYPPRVFDREPQLEAATLYVVGGLYGNLEALAAVRALVQREPGPAAIVFNGDFHWFDVDAAGFAEVSEAALAHHALRGNVETEIAVEESDAGCGCAYPADVSDAEVSRSNEILGRLRETARGAPRLRERMGALPMHLVARVGEARIAIVHGDAASLAGWGFAHDRLDDPRHARWIGRAFRDANAQVFASSHTCLPAMRLFEVDGERRAIANNGAAGMPNFAGTRHGIATRVSTRPFAGPERLYGAEVAGAHVDAIALAYDPGRWTRRFAANWPAGSPAHASYHRRIVEGPRHGIEAARPGADRVV